MRAYVDFASFSCSLFLFLCSRIPCSLVPCHCPHQVTEPPHCHTYRLLPSAATLAPSWPLAATSSPSPIISSYPRGLQCVTFSSCLSQHDFLMLTRIYLCFFILLLWQYSSACRGQSLAVVPSKAFGSLCFLLFQLKLWILFTVFPVLICFYFLRDNCLRM